jgi:hypothetical protein
MMPDCVSLVAAPVVSGDSCHDLLRFGAQFIRDILHEFMRDLSTQGSGNASMMENLHRSILPQKVSEAEIGRIAWLFQSKSLNGRQITGA